MRFLTPLHFLVDWTNILQRLQYCSNKEDPYQEKIGNTVVVLFVVNYIGKLKSENMAKSEILDVATRMKCRI